MYIRRVELKNFRCFESVVIEADVTTRHAPWTLLTGDNASGKTTLLKAIALGLCDGSSAAGLLRESDSGYIRHGQNTATIKIDLVDLAEDGSESKYQIKTSLARLNRHLERLEQETTPNCDFPWERIFVCGYGAGRGTSGTGDVAGYTAISAVYNLFNYSEGLQNPELSIRRLPYRSDRQTAVVRTLEDILNLSNLRLQENGASDMGISVSDPRRVPIAFRDLADGYKSTLLWVTDFLGWALSSGRTLGESLDGIVIIDEIEQHLHPRWQKRVVSDLRKIWPHVQFFAATHSPLVARSFQSTFDDGPYRHYHLKDSEGGSGVEAVSIPSLGGSRTDQILASEAFDYLIDDDPDADRILEELSFLVGIEFLSDERQELLRDYLSKVEQIQSIRRGQTLTELSAGQLIDLTQRSLINDLGPRPEEVRDDPDQ